MNQPVQAMFELYLDRAALKESSVALKRRALKFFVSFFGNRPIGEVDYGMAEDFKKMLKEGRSDQSANIYLQNFKPFWSWLLKRGYIEVSPFADITLYSVGEQLRQIYMPEEIERIVSIGSTRWKVAVLLALCSMRRAEVLNLVVRDINYDQGYILVSPKKETAETWCWDIKNYNQAILPLPETIELPNTTVKLHSLLIELQENLKDGQPYVVLPPNHYQTMLRRKREGKLTHEHRNCPWQGFDSAYKRLLKRAKVTPRRFHDLRITFATNMSQHLTLTQTQALMRHSSPNTTARHYIRHEKQKLIAESSKILKKIMVR